VRGNVPAAAALEIDAMTKAAILQALIQRTRDDLVFYFQDAACAARAQELIAWSLSGDQRLAAARDELEAMLPNTEEDGSWESSYALNTGAMILCLIDYQSTQDERHYTEAITLFFDTIDFKVQQLLERQHVYQPAEQQIQSHPFYVAEREWFDNLDSHADPHA